MFEYDIRNIHTGERDMMFGYDVLDAFRRYPELDPKDWQITHVEYGD